MIVYGDPSYFQPLAAFVTRLHHLLASPGIKSNIDDVRTLLVLAGQLEQAILDELPGWASEYQEVTDAAAAAFLALWAETQSGFAHPLPEIGSSLARMEAALAKAPALVLDLEVKMPEGFSFYTLYPDAYCASAVRWLEDHPEPGNARVIGLRTIGTTLSAIVSATLIAAGWNAPRMTVRPSGHPFSRELRLKKEALSGADWVLAVDEGPGMSGSSLASVAEASFRAGFARERISFFPSHAGEPGAEASPEVREWWASTPRYVTGIDDLRWHGRSLREILADRTLSIYPELDLVGIEDLSAGRWREIVYEDRSEWPEVATQFERTKYRIVLSDGSAVLWKFVGFAFPPGEDPLPILSQRALEGWTAPPLGVSLGFLATPWIEGRPLTREELTHELLDHMRRYVAAAAGPSMTRREAEAAHIRLTHMLYWNAFELLGTEPSMPGSFAVSPGERTYGDGRLAPHEWLRTADGRVIKVDAWGSRYDHTAVGVQPLAWDEAAIEFYGARESAHPEAVYNLAYRALQVGVASMSNPILKGDDRMRRDFQALLPSTPYPGSDGKSPT